MDNPVVRDSDEWNMLDFALHLRCRSSRVNLLQAWNITKPETVSIFSRCSQKNATVEAFIDAETLDRNNSVQEVCSRGFNVGSNGFKITIGNIELPNLPLTRTTSKEHIGEPRSGALDDNGKVLPAKNCTMANAMYGERGVYEYFVCDVALGKSIAVKDEVEAQRTRLSMPVEYDSVFLEDCEKDRFRDVTVMPRNSVAQGGSVDHLQEELFTEGVLPQVAFKREYIVYGSSQILPRYLIQFECDAAAEETFALPLCDNCQNSAATLYCQSDNAKICVKCDEKLHSHNKVVSRHIRVPLNQMPKPAARCRLHHSKLYNMYCTVCHVPICQLCTSNHIHGQAANEGRLACFIPIASAYDAAIYEMEQQSSHVLAARREYLRTVLKDVNKIKEAVQANCEKVEASCYENMECTLKELRAGIDKYLEVLVTEQTENKRQLIEMDWVEHFADYIKNTLMSADYLRSWLRHCRLRKELEGDSFKKPLQELFPDLALQGELSIMHERSSEDMHQ